MDAIERAKQFLSRERVFNTTYEVMPCIIAVTIVVLIMAVVAVVIHLRNVKNLVGIWVEKDDPQQNRDVPRRESDDVDCIICCYSRSSGKLQMDGRPIEVDGNYFFSTDSGDDFSGIWDGADTIVLLGRRHGKEYQRTW